MLRTVFVVGAGASTEFGLGVGSDLAREIREALRAHIPDGTTVLTASDPLSRSIAKLGATGPDLFDAAKTIRRGIGFSNSIDDFLHENRDRALVVSLGKLAIAYCMLQQESRSQHLKRLDEDVEPRFAAFSELNQSWLGRLFRLLKRGRVRDEARDVFGACSFITFNYDRCIEKFIWPALADALDLPDGEARSVASSVLVEHVYGSLGPLQGSGSVPFGTDRADLNAISQNIKTYTEEVSGTSSAIIQSRLEEADQIVFLGYSFHEQGMNLLFPELPGEYHRVFWTRFGVHDTVSARMESRFARANHRFINGGRCSEALERWQFDLLASR